MIITEFPDSIMFEFQRHTPGDPFRYRNALEIPAVFGFPIQIEPHSDYCLIDVSCMYWEQSKVRDYISNHKRIKGIPNKILEVCYL